MSYEYSAFVRYNDPDDPLRLKNLSETPTVTAYEGGDGDSIAGASIANITTGIYKVKVTHTALEPVLFKVIPHNDDKDDFPDEALLAEEVRFVLDDCVTLANTQGAITWGQQKILADKAGEGALHIVNENEDGVGQYNSGAVGQGNFGSMQGQVNWGSIAGQYNIAEGNVGVGQHNHSEGMSGIGQSNQATFPVDGYDPALALEATLTAIKGAGWTNETLKAIKDADGGGGLDAAGVRSAVGLASANLDTQLGNIKTDTGNIKTDTDNVATRLTALRAGYLDKLNVAGALANTTNAGDFKADVTGLAKTTDLSGLAKTSDLSGLAEKTDIPSDYAKANDLSGLAKTTDITALNNLSAAEMLNEVVVGTFTLREILTILAAKSDGYPATGGGTTTITYGGIDGTPGVIVETVDEDGNRSKVEFNL